MLLVGTTIDGGGGGEVGTSTIGKDIVLFLFGGGIGGTSVEEVVRKGLSDDDRKRRL